jgi:hypothetical protein
MRQPHRNSDPFEAAVRNGAPRWAARRLGHVPLTVSDAGSIGRSSDSMFTRFTSFVDARCQVIESLGGTTFETRS